MGEGGTPRPRLGETAEKSELRIVVFKIIGERRSQYRYLEMITKP